MQDGRGFFADGPDVETNDNKCETDCLRPFTNVCSIYSVQLATLQFFNHLIYSEALGLSKQIMLSAVGRPLLMSYFTNFKLINALII